MAFKCTIENKAGKILFEGVLSDTKDIFLAATDAAMQVRHVERAGLKTKPHKITIEKV